MTGTPGGATRASDVEFGIRFLGPAVESNELDVRTLAPSLLSVANLLQRLNRELHPADPDLAVNVRALERGSFLVHLHLLYHDAETLLTSVPAIAALNLAEVVEKTGQLVNFVKRRHRHGIVEQRPLAGGDVNVVFGDNTSITVNQTIISASEKGTVQADLTALAKPVEHPGIDSVVIERGNEVVGDISSDDVEAFRFVPRDGVETLGTTVRDAHLSIVASQWTSSKWRFSDGGPPFWAEIKDEAFNGRVRGGERFGSRDEMDCRLRETQWRDSGGQLHKDVEIVEVVGVEHFQPPTPLFPTGHDG